jgi:hypothetical protein
MARKARTKEGVTKSIRRSIALSVPGTDSAQLLSDIIEEWGGTKNLARSIKQAFDAADDGSMIRQRFLEMIQRLIITNTTHDLTKNLDPTEMSDEELDEIATHYAGRVLQQAEGADGLAQGQASGEEEDARDGAALAEAELQPLDEQSDEWDF